MPSNAEYESDMQRIWQNMSQVHPEFQRSHAVMNDPWQVEGLLLGDYIGFCPFPGAIVMDIGANAGILTAYWALNGANVTAYEADPVTYAILTAMLDNNKLIVNAVHGAVWTYTGEIMFKGSGNECQGSKGRNGAIQVPQHGAFTGNLGQEQDMVTIPCVSLVEALGDKIWDCVKFDIEGAEFELLMNADLRVFDRVRYMHVELHNGWASDDLYHRLVDKLGTVFEIKGSVCDHKNDPWHGRYHWVQLTNRNRI